MTGGKPWAKVEAREDASTETGQPITTYPEQCIWEIDQILNPEWLPKL